MKQAGLLGRNGRKSERALPVARLKWRLILNVPKNSVTTRRRTTALGKNKKNNKQVKFAFSFWT
jgi:hypothetical protein